MIYHVTRTVCMRNVLDVHDLNVYSHWFIHEGKGRKKKKKE